MKNEENQTKNEQFLLSDTYLSDKGIELSQNAIIKRYTDRDKNEFYQKYTGWKRKENEIIVFTLYAYADLKLNQEFDCIFNYDNPDEFVFEKFILTQSIYEGWIPTNTVENGHKHLLVFRFENEIPKILFKLHKEDTFGDTRPKIYTKLGFCNQKDFEAIANNLKKRHLLIEKYGMEYWKYIDKEI